MSKLLWPLVVAALAITSGPVKGEQVTVAVAANFTDAMRDLVPLFERETGHTARVSFGSTGKLYAQIEHGAPFEVFLAADSVRPAKAEKEGLGVTGTRFTYARGTVVLWSPQAGYVTGSGALTGDYARLAIANPKTAPYGLAARQVMEHLGVWNRLSHKLVRGDSIAQTFQFVVTGNARLGFVALSQVRALPRFEQGSYWQPPAELYAPIEQQAILLAKGGANPAARAFLDFLKRDPARTLISRYGYGLN